MNITEDQAKEILLPYHQTFYDIIVEAWKRFHETCQDIKHILSPRSQSSIVFDFIKDNVNQKFQDNKKNIKIFEKRGLFLLNFDNKVMIRFKKLRNNKASCVLTRQSFCLFNQLEVPGIPSPQKFIVGYELNSIRTEINSISVLYPKNSNQNFWSYDLEPVVAPVPTLEIPYRQIVAEQEVIIPKEERITIKDATGTKDE